MSAELNTRLKKYFEDKDIDFEVYEKLILGCAGINPSSDVSNFQSLYIEENYWKHNIKYEEKEKQLKNLDKKSNGFYKKEAYNNLEVEHLEALIGNWKKEQYCSSHSWEQPTDTIWTNASSNLLSYMIRNPLTEPSLIRYIQKGVKELSENKDLWSLSVDRPGNYDLVNENITSGNAFDSINMYRLNYSLTKSMLKVLETAESACLKDLKKAIERNSKNGNLDTAHKIADKKKHKLLVDMAVKYTDAYGNSEQMTEIKILDEAGPVGKSYFVENRPFNDKVNYTIHTPIWNAILNTITEEGFEAIDNITFQRTILGYMAGISNLTHNFKRHDIKYAFPEINSSGKKEILFKNATHPFLLKDNPVPNTINLNENPSTYLIAGANNGGKTTYAKMAGILTIMAQMGAPIPAEYARISPVKNIYTHFSKNESVLEGKGKFMDELDRLKNILENANKTSLVLLDEPLSGTSNEDARDISLDLIYGLHQIGCPTIYSTHLHELQKKVSQNKRYSNVMNLFIETKGTDKNPEFTHNIREGIAGKSYGTHYATANLPIKDILKKRGLL